MFGKTVKGIDGDKFEHALQRGQEEGRRQDRPRAQAAAPAAAGRSASSTYIRTRPATTFPADPVTQLREAIEAVFKSWNTDARQDLPAHGAHPRRPRHRGERADDGVRQHGPRRRAPASPSRATRSPASKELYGDYLANAQGEDVVAGVRDTEPIKALKRHMPKVYAEFEGYARQAREALQGRAGPRVHDRARQALHAADPLAPSARARPR